MRISCIIPVYNAGRYLADALDSVLAQDWPLHEIIVVDDGSTDHSASVMRSYGGRTTVEAQRHAGVATARNRGLRASSGDVIAFQDADDLWPHGRLRKLAEAMELNPAVDIVAGAVEFLDERELNAGARHVTTHRPFHMASLLIRRRVFDRVGTFNEDLAVAEDTEFMMRVRQLSVGLQPVDVLSLIYLLHAGNISLDIARTQSNTLDALGTFSATRPRVR